MTTHEKASEMTTVLNNPLPFQVLLVDQDGPGVHYYPRLLEKASAVELGYPTEKEDMALLC